MNILKPQSIEEYIVSLLQKNSRSGSELLTAIQSKRPGTTKQALYASLRKLRSDEIVVVHKMRISLSSIWVTKMAEFFTLAKHFYTKTTTTDEGFLNLEDGDRVTYSFKNPNVTDIFWGHAFDILAEITPITEPVFLYNPHDWFMLARPETEKLLFKKFAKAGKQLLILVGDAKPLDKYIIKEFDGTIAQYHPTNELVFDKRNYYVNIFDDFIIEVHLDEITTKKIDEFYNTANDWNPENEAVLKKIIANEGKNKLTISKNRKKAEHLKKIFRKYFYIKSLKQNTTHI
ncbi:MAG: hypothetical protein WCG20_02120 [bacterium]